MGKDRTTPGLYELYKPRGETPEIELVTISIFSGAFRVKTL
jgi:hypothetical protein